LHSGSNGSDRFRNHPEAPVPVPRFPTLVGEPEPPAGQEPDPTSAWQVITGRSFLGAVAEARLSDLPALLGVLAHAQAMAIARLTLSATASPTTPPVPERWITAMEAAAIACVGKKCIYEWAQGKRWASRPTRRCLRINEAGFRSWLANRRLS
jgi:hypothetical protein